MNSRLKYIDDSWGMGNKITPDDIDWLITQVKDLRDDRIKKSKTIGELKKKNSELKGQINQHIRFLDKNNKGWEDKWNFSACLEKNSELEQENKRYREALEFYADEKNYDYKINTDSAGDMHDMSYMEIHDVESKIMYDYGEKATKALDDNE